MSWFSPSREISPTQPLAHYPHCPHWDVGENQKCKNEKNLWVFIQQFKKESNSCTCKQSKNKELIHYFPSADRFSAISRKAGLQHA